MSQPVEQTEPKTSNELLECKKTKERQKAAAVYALLNEKKRNRGTFRVGPSSALLEAKKFIPMLREANSRLQSEIEQEPSNRNKFDIEHVQETEGDLIEMDLALYERSDTEEDSDASSDESGECRIDHDTEERPKLARSDEKSNLVQEIDRTTS